MASVFPLFIGSREVGTAELIDETHLVLRLNDREAVAAVIGDALRAQDYIIDPSTMSKIIVGDEVR